MNSKILNLKFTDIAGIGTWVMVYGLSLYWLVRTADGFHQDIPLVSLFFIIYLICFILVTRDPSILVSKLSIYSILALQLTSAFSLLWILPVSFLPILTIIWVSMLPHVVTFSRSIIISLAVVVLWFSIYQIRWQENAIFSALLYGSFHLFSVLMMHHAKTAEDATAEALRLNSELMSTRQLLSEVSRQNERTRIARDLHDLLGHHLTALIINLQIAGYLTKGEAKDKINQCHSLAKLLMSDVREAVSSLRENQSLNIQMMISLLINNVPKLKIHKLIDAHINIEDIESAKAILSCIQEAITNSLKHSHASEFWIEIASDEKQLKLKIRDNGRVNGSILAGNGLNGMAERIAALNGQLAFNVIESSLNIEISVPSPRIKTAVISTGVIT